MSQTVYGPIDQQRVQEMRVEPAVPAETRAVGWQCPRCLGVFAPSTPACTHCVPHREGRVPGHILRAMEADIKRAQVAPGTRITRGSFVIRYVEMLIEAVQK